MLPKHSTTDTRGMMQLLPPAPDKCQQCAVDHLPEYPHNQQSLFWQYWFYGQHGRWPTWTDAMNHCSDDMKQQWIEVLKEHGIEMGTEASECANALSARMNMTRT